MAKAATLKLTVSARLAVVAPPQGVAFALQRGRHELDAAAISTGADLIFDFNFTAARGPNGAVRFSGKFVQGPAGRKFVYVNSGTSAGQYGSCWTRRAKIGLESITWKDVERTVAIGARLYASIRGTGRDGGPSCATVPLLGDGWKIHT